MKNGAIAKKVLVPVDGSELSDRVLEPLAGFLAEGESDVRILQVVSSSGFDAPGSGKKAFEEAKKRTGALALALASKTKSATAKPEVMVGDDPAAQILEFARKFEPTLIVMATHGRTGVSRFVRGSVAERVLRECSHPLLLANPFSIGDATFSPKKILVPLDGSDSAAAILPQVREIAQRSGSEVVFFHSIAGSVADSTADKATVHASARDRFESYQRFLGEVPSRVLTTNKPPVTAILAAVKSEKVGLVAMTTHGRSGVARWALGSVAEQVLRECRCPVLLLRGLKVGEQPDLTAPGPRAKKRIGAIKAKNARGD